MMKEKRTLIRVVRTKEGTMFIDPTGKANGRGAYVCRTCAKDPIFRNKRKLDRSFKCAVDPQIYDLIEESLKASEQ